MTTSGEPSTADQLRREIRYRIPLTHEYLERLLDRALSEARATPPALDVERLTRLAMAIDCGYYPGSTDADRAENKWADGVTVNCCDEHRAIATEYARLSASGESPEPSGEQPE
jgi:hypothetical protein